MLFTSHQYLFAYLPVVLIVFFILGRRDPRTARLWLIAASIFFYAWWNYKFVLLLVSSILFNHGIAFQLDKHRDLPWMRRRTILLAGLAVNLSVLAYFKYANFFITAINNSGASHWNTLNVLLPLGISFFTFTQITYLVDIYKGVARKEGLATYALFVTYFPHLIAGPILHYRQIMPQFHNPENYRINLTNLAVGVALFSIGLAKKILIADPLGPYADSLFSSAGDGVVPAPAAAWGGVLAYAFQLYFDFSGYCDMAIGSARMLNVKMPDNFDSPYKSASLIEFWRRWHITLCNFLRDYVYIPLGGARSGAARKHANLFVTMLLGGLWHGAAWTFVLWGAFHGLLLCLNHLWRSTASRLLPVSAWVGIPTTFVAVTLGWVLFRSESVSSAKNIFTGLFSIAANTDQGWAAVMGQLSMDQFLGLMGVCASAVWLMPNTIRIARYIETLKERHVTIKEAILGFACALALFTGVVTQFGAVTESPFLYFQF